MAATRTSGITVDTGGLRTINKEHRGERIFARLGLVGQEQAERRLAKELERLDWELERRAHARPLFSDCAKRFLLEAKYKRSQADIAWHLGMLSRYVGDLEIRKVHDETLRPLIEARLADGVSATTINRTLEVARTILHRAARAYRDRDGFPWLETAPPLITMLRESPRLPHPINWDEQDRIFRRLPDHLARMALFAVNTGLRDANLCGLQWSWEVRIAEFSRSVFVIPAQVFKSRRPHGHLVKQANLALSRRGTQTVLRVAGNRGAKIAGGQRRAGPTSARQVHEPRRVEWERGITRSTEVPQLKGVANFHCQVLKFRAPAAFEPMTPGWYRQAGKSPKRAFPSSSPRPGRTLRVQSHSLHLGNPRTRRSIEEVH